MSSNRVMIFIDGSNLHWGIKGYNRANQTNLKLDYVKLTSLLAAGRNLTRTIYYCSKPVPPGRPTQTRFFDYLRHIGIQVVEKPLKVRFDPTVNRNRSVEKGVDVALAVDLIGMAWENAYDVAILVSGDADYVGAVSKVMSKGKNVEVACFQQTLSKELKQTALKITVFDSIVNQIKL